MQHQETTMELTFLTSMNRDQLKEFLGGIIEEAIFEGPSDKAKRPIFANPEDEPMVGITEAARITGLAVNTLYDKTHQRAIPHYKKGKRVYFRPSELTAWIGTGRVATQDEIAAKAATHVMTHPLNPWGKRKGAKGK